MKQLNKFETTKLFYDEYPYKLVVVNALSHIFRDKNLSRAKEDLSKLQQQFDQGEPLKWGPPQMFERRDRPIEIDTFIEAKNLYIEFSKQTDYKLRVSNPYMQIYSHDYDWLVMLSKKLKGVTEFWEPSSENVSQLAANTILVKHPTDFNFKVTLGYNCDPNLAEWIKKNPDKAKAGPVCLQTIQRGGYTRGLYFYARDEKILQLLNLFVSNVVRIDKLVYNRKIDK